MMVKWGVCRRVYLKNRTKIRNLLTNGYSVRDVHNKMAPHLDGMSYRSLLVYVQRYEDGYSVDAHKETVDAAPVKIVAKVRTSAESKKEEKRFKVGLVDHDKLDEIYNSLG